MCESFIEKVTINNPIGNLYRKNHVLVLVVDNDGDIILGKKRGFYPSHIARMVGGGIDANEDPLVAIQREVKEELAMNISADNFKKLCIVITQANTNEGYMEMRTHIFLVCITDSKSINPGDDISEIKMFSTKKYIDLIKSMTELTGQYVTDKFSFAWQDWGKVYAPIHRHALDQYNILSNHS